ncbi:hypothetical protein BKA62DRAFT_668149 [Auriculariales sp. MPI-PUGE-AT-0066]|nr:hypothetical protein BKA62DRAFT_668149 [Auriculariales sp. MPI-PUGE-AT-0066]
MDANFVWMRAEGKHYYYPQQWQGGSQLNLEARATQTGQRQHGMGDADRRVPSPTSSLSDESANGYQAGYSLSDYGDDNDRHEEEEIQPLSPESTEHISLAAPASAHKFLRRDETGNGLQLQVTDRLIGRSAMGSDMPMDVDGDDNILVEEAYSIPTSISQSQLQEGIAGQLDHERDRLAREKVRKEVHKAVRSVMSEARKLKTEVKVSAYGFCLTSEDKDNKSADKCIGNRQTALLPALPLTAGKPVQRCTSVQSPVTFENTIISSNSKGAQV